MEYEFLFKFVAAVLILCAVTIPYVLKRDIAFQNDIRTIMTHKQLTYIPKTVTRPAIISYLCGLTAVSLLYINHIMQLQFILFGLVFAVGFFHYSNQLSKQWHVTRVSDARFAKDLFTTALLLRLAYVIFSYFYYEWATGQPFMYHSADEGAYHAMALEGCEGIKNGHAWVFPFLQIMEAGSDTSDLGYATYLSYVYWLTGNSIFLTRVIKALLGAWTVSKMYQLARRNFGESVGRMTGIVCAIAPNLIYYCGLHLKELEMVCIVVLFIERADYVLRSTKMTFKDTIVVLLLGLALFGFRTVLGVVAFLSVGVAVLFTKSKTVSWVKRFALIAFAVLVLGAGYGNRLAETINALVAEQQDGYQEKGMEFRSIREGGNTFAKYAGAAVFAPMIFTIPFPTAVDIEGQENQQLLNGGNFVKNVFSFFAIFALIFAVFSGKWRENALPWAFAVGYLAVIAMSNFAQSERFHQPAYPFIMMFACCGISQMTKPKFKRWYSLWCGLMAVAMIAWTWFKLKGRGMV